MTTQLDFPRTTFAEAAMHMPGPVFAAVDGAQFENLPALLKGAGLFFRSLFLGHADEEAEKVGPWFVDLSQPSAMESFLAVLGEKPAAVLWSCPSGETALYRHLRGLNMAIVPMLRDDAPERDAGAVRPAEDYREEHVLFRHFDPRVLAQVLPVLDEGQFARVLGPAHLIALPREGGGKPRFAPALEHSVVVPRGPLRLRPEQMDEISDIRVQASRKRIAAFLKENGSDLIPGLTDEMAWRVALESEPSAKALGIETERGQARWAYVMLLSHGKAAQTKEVTDYIRSGERSPDEQVKSLITYTADALRSGPSGGQAR